jgi:hypothetical protein
MSDDAHLTGWTRDRCSGGTAAVVCRTAVEP